MHMVCAAVFFVIELKLQNIFYVPITLLHISLQCNLPCLDECIQMAETVYADGDIFRAVKYYLLSSEPEKALPIGISFVKGQFYQ